MGVGPEVHKPPSLPQALLCIFWSTLGHCLRAPPRILRSCNQSGITNDKSAQTRIGPGLLSEALPKVSQAGSHWWSTACLSAQSCSVLQRQVGPVLGAVKQHEARAPQKAPPCGACSSLEPAVAGPRVLEVFPFEHQLSCMPRCAVSGSGAHHPDDCTTSLIIAKSHSDSHIHKA